ncbi:RNA 2',3'-cyclic phosphodiesterase [Actinokineospora sp.]|uniref:RNA 2',3'-cyclic phosphodiesterase n=1 Tax=Actinokineospora sp. TaxID=1872133 RepID=UPI004037F0BE
MTRLFSALLLPAPVADHLADYLAASPSPQSVGLRATPREQWHITVGFYGEDDPVERTRVLRDRVPNVPAPRLALAGAGAFPGVCWMGVRPVADADAESLRVLAAAAGAAADFTPHVTVARGSTRADAAGRLGRDLGGYLGPEWVPDALVLFRSDLGSHGPHYTPIDRFGPLGNG